MQPRAEGFLPWPQPTKQEEGRTTAQAARRRELEVNPPREEGVRDWPEESSKKCGGGGGAAVDPERQAFVSKWRRGFLAARQHDLATRRIKLVAAEQFAY